MCEQEAEALRIELEKKYALYRNQDAKGEDQLSIEKTRSTIKALQTRMVVAIQAVDGAATAVQKLRDEELYPQLIELLEGYVVQLSLSHKMSSWKSNFLFSISNFGLNAIENIIRWVNRFCVKFWHQTPSESAKRDFESVCMEVTQVFWRFSLSCSKSVGRLLKTGFLVCHTKMGGPS